MDANMVWKPAKCGECGRRMKVLMHKQYGIVTPMPPPPELCLMLEKGQVKGTFCCDECGRSYCYGCSDLEKVCACGAKGTNWREGLYMEDNTTRWWRRLFGG